MPRPKIKQIDGTPPYAGGLITSGLALDFSDDIADRSVLTRDGSLIRGTTGLYPTYGQRVLSLPAHAAIDSQAAVFSQTENKVYVVPASNHDLTDLYHIDCTTNTIVATPHGFTWDMEVYPFSGGCYMPEITEGQTQDPRVYYTPRQQYRENGLPNGQVMWFFLQNGYLNPYWCLSGGAPTRIEASEAFRGNGVLDPLTNRVFLAPRGLQTLDFVYIPPSNYQVIPLVTAFGTAANPQNNLGYNGGVLDEINNRIYFMPEYGGKNYGHYVDLSGPTVVEYEFGQTLVVQDYTGIFFDWATRRVYIIGNHTTGFVSYYMDCDDEEWHDFTPGNAPAYHLYGGTLDTTHHRIYMNPQGATWYYLDLSTHNFVSFSASNWSSSTVMQTGAYDPSGNRMYFTGGVSPWRYLDLSVETQGGRLTTSVENSSTQRVFQSDLTKGVTGLELVDEAAYFVYLGRTVSSVIPKYVEFYVATAGDGAQTAEVGLFSSPLPPSKAGQSLTKLVSTGTVDDLTTTGVKRNTTAFDVQVASGTHLWAGIRTNMGTTPPTVTGLLSDMEQGAILRTTTAAALTDAGPWTGSIVTAALTENCPDLRAVLD